MKINIFIKILIPFFLLFVSVASVWFLVFVPFSAEVQEYKNNRTLLSEVEQKAGLKGNLRKEFNKISQQAKLIDSAFIGETRVLEFIETLESIAVLTSNTYDTDVLQEIKLLISNHCRMLSLVQSTTVDKFSRIEGVSHYSMHPAFTNGFTVLSTSNA